MIWDFRIICINKVCVWGGGGCGLQFIYVVYQDKLQYKINNKKDKRRKKERVCQKNIDYKQIDNYMEFLKYQECIILCIFDFFLNNNQFLL